MARFCSSRWMRLLAGTTMLIAGIAIFVARPGIALAHHVTIAENADCNAWSTKAEYVGGPEDRKVVVDVTINGEHISQTFYFDLAPGHLGRVGYYVLYERSGSGSLTTSGSVIMYQRDSGGAYTQVADSDYTSVNLVCASSPTATATPTDTPLPPSATPTATSTVEAQGTTTPIPTDTPTTEATATGTPPPAATIIPPEGTTPIARPTDTPVATNTPNPSNTPSATDTPPASTHTPVATNTPAAVTTPAASTTPLTSIVLGLVPPEQPTGRTSPPQPTGRAFPATGNGVRQRGGVAGGLAGAIVAGIGLAVVASGLRKREA